MVALMIPPLQHAQAQSTPAGGNAAANQSAVSLGAPETRQAVPGEYVTLIFTLSGQGEYTLKADGGPDWVPITAARTVKVSGSTIVPITFRVPAQARVGRSPPLNVTVSADAQVVATGQTYIEVLPQARVAIRAPGQLTGLNNQRVSYQVEVTNQGNQADTVLVKATNVDGLPQLSQTSVYLEPGESKAVGVSFGVGDASPGYLYIAFLEATSKNDPSVKARTRTEVVFNPARVIAGGSNVGPQLTFGIRAGVEGGMNWTPSGNSGYVQYSVQPKIGGQLSDYAKTDGSLFGLDGNNQRPLPSGLSLGLRIDARNWNLTTLVGQTGAAVQANLYRGDWTFSPRAAYSTYQQGQNAFSGGFGVSGPVLGGLLEADAGTNYQRGTDTQSSVRWDQLSARYSRSITPKLSFSLAGLAAGQASDGGYAATALGYEQIAYNTETFDLTQSYSGTLSGVHTIGISGGLRALKPFGARGALVVQYQPQGVTYTGTGLLSYSASNGFGVTLGGRYQHGTLPTSVPQWSVTTGLRTPSLYWRDTALGAAGLYTIATTEGQPNLLKQEVNASAVLNHGPLSNTLTALWQREPQTDGTANQHLKLGLTSTYQFRDRDTVNAGYTYERIQDAGESTSHALQVGWSHAWTPRVSTEVDYRRAWLSNNAGNSTPEAAGISVGVQDVVVPGLNAQVGGYVSGPNGLLNGDLSSGVRLGLNYNVAWIVNTPKAVVNLFGGRKGGEIKGVLYRDDNFNNQRDPGEAGLPGVSVSAGGETTKTAADGTYTLRVPNGSYELKFPAGVPATLEPLSLDTMNVKENSSNHEDVAFAPVVQSEVLIFHDENNNGQRDEGEGALPYVGVSFTGPVTRLLQADGRGYVRISTLPPGHYRVTLNPAELPEGYKPTSAGVETDLRSGEKPATIELGAAAPPRQNVTTYTSSNIALIGSLTPTTAVPGSKLKLVVRVQNAGQLKVEAFDQTYAPPVQDGRAELEFTVPGGLAAGTYDINVVASQGSTQKATTLKVIVLAPVGTGGKP